MASLKKKPRTPPKPPQEYQNSNYGHLEVKMKNIGCVFCKKSFVVREYFSSYRRNVMPLTRSCGHQICDECSRSKSNEACPICEDWEPPAGGQMSTPMINVYVMGLLQLNKSRTNHTEEPKIDFEKSLKSKAQKSTVVEPCVECGQVSDVKCIPCKNTSFCTGCFTRVHQFRTNKDHVMTPLDQNTANRVVLPISCPEHKEMRFTHWCENCEKPCCPDCFVDIHRHHSPIKLKEKNQQLVKECSEAYENLGETLLYTKDSRKRVAEALKVPQQAERIASVEAEINQHFLHLHGVLQNMEGKMIETLRAQRDQQEKRLQEIEKELERNEKDIEAGIFMATATKTCIENVNLTYVVQKLVDLASSPCYFVQEPIEHSESIRFHSKLLDIIPQLENHCNLEVVPTPQTSHLLTRTFIPHNDLPDITPQMSTLPPLPFEGLKILESSVSMSSLASSNISETETIHNPHNAIPLLLDNSNKRKYSDVYVTHINDPSNFYIRKASDNVKWTTIQEKLKSYDTEGVLPTEIKLRSVYAVKCDENDEWQRASVIGVATDHDKGIKTYEVQFIDIGSQEKGILQENMRELDESLLDIEPLAENHSLIDLYPRNKETWDPEATEAFFEFVQNAGNMTLIMMKIGESPHDIDILCPKKKTWIHQSVRDHLVFLEVASFMNHEKLYEMNRNSMAILHSDGFDLEKFHQVFLTEAYDADATPNNMYVRKASYTDTSFKGFMDDLQAEYDRTKHTRGKIYTPEIGLICAARSCEKKWYRARIVGTPGKQNVEAFYVDYGVTDTIKYNRLRPLDTLYMKAATRAIKISLKDVAPVNGSWSPDAMLQLREWMKNSIKLVAFEKIDDCYSVALVDHLTNENLNARLVKMGFAESTGPASKQTPLRRIPEIICSPDSCDSPKPKQKRQKNKRKISRKRINSSSDADRTPTKNTINRLPRTRDVQEDDPWKVPVIPLRTVSPDEIYVSTVDNEDNYKEMDKKLQKAYRDYKTCQDCEWSVGHVCVIHLKSSNVYRRAEIREIKSPDEVSVFLFDVGEIIFVCLKDLQPLFETFNEYPANVVQIKLGGIYPPGGSQTWPTASCDKLREIISNNLGNRFFIEKVTDDDGSPMVVDFFVNEVKKCSAVEPIVREMSVINRKLIEEGLALPIRNFNDKKIKILGTDVEKGFDIGDKNPMAPEGDPDDSEDRETSDTDDSGTIRDIESDHSDVPDEEPHNYSCKSLPEDAPSWLPAEPLTDDEFTGMGLFLDWGGFLYMNSPENALKVKKIDEELQKVYELDEDVTVISDWKIGDLCIAKMHVLKTWHRAQVMGYKDNHLVIYFVDYGNIEWAHPSVVRKKLMFEDVPILAHKCKIKGMEPDNQWKAWTKHHLDQLHHALVQRKWRVQVVETLPEYLLVILTHPTHPHANVLDIMRHDYSIEVTGDKSSSSEADDVIIEEIYAHGARLTQHRKNSSDYLLSSEIDLDAQYSSESPESYSSYDKAVNSYRESTVLQMFDNCAEIYPSLTVPDDVYMFHGALGEVSHERANVVWVHAAATEESEYITTLSKIYRRVMREMMLEADDQPDLEDFEEGTPCCAMYEADDSWYRCRVQGTMQDDDQIWVQVNFVDWGNSQWVKASDLKVPKEEWVKLPAMAIKCYLHGIKVGGDNTTAREWLKKFGTSRNHPLTITVEGREGDCLSARLFVDEECDKLLYQPLLDKGMFKVDVKKTLEKEFV